MNLLEFQRRMATDVCRPLTADYRMQTATDDGQPMETAAADYVKPNSRLSSGERLEIYNRQYWFRIINAVSEDFPALESLLGNKRFDALILAYLKATPSTSWNLRDLSGKLPEFITEHPSLAGRKHRQAADVARLEWAYIEALDRQAGMALGVEQLQSIGPQTTLSLQPHLQLLQLEYPVDDLVLAVRRQTAESEVVSNAVQNRDLKERATLPALKPKRIYLAVHRYDQIVFYRRLEKEWFLILEALRGGATVEEGLQAGLHKSRKSVLKQQQSVQSCFAICAELGWFIAIPK